MKNYSELKKLLLSIDGRGYSSYKKLTGEYNFEKYILSIEHIQSDPFAPPSRCKITMSLKESGIPRDFIDSKLKITAVCDFLTRTFERNIKNSHAVTKASGKSGSISIDHCGQEILQRTSTLISNNTIETRFELGMPASGRKVLGKLADKIFNEILPFIIDKSLIMKNIDKAGLEQQIQLVLDQNYIRHTLKEKKLVAFIANGSVLPRQNGISDTPLKDAVSFKSPQNLEVEFNLPSHKTIRGMGIPEGITLIVGGGYHGKSTLLRALELGIYDHIKNDGREFVITRDDAVKIRAEDGRSIEKVNISPFINNLPNNKDTSKFSTENASGSTSQAANVIEALEAKSRLLLIDEDTSATNFMIRDEKMQQLVKKDKEPITPFIKRIKQMYSENNVSAILVMGGSGDYFNVADHVIMMDEYIPKDVTKRAKEIISSDPAPEITADDIKFTTNSNRVIAKIPLGPRDRIKSKGKYSILCGKSQIELAGLEQLCTASQTNCTAAMLQFLIKNVIDGTKPIYKCIDELLIKIEKSGFSLLAPYTSHPGFMALPRKYEVCAAINRYRNLKIR